MMKLFHSGLCIIMHIYFWATYFNIMHYLYAFFAFHFFRSSVFFLSAFRNCLTFCLPLHISLQFSVHKNCKQLIDPSNCTKPLNCYFNRFALFRWIMVKKRCLVFKRQHTLVFLVKDFLQTPAPFYSLFFLQVIYLIFRHMILTNWRTCLKTKKPAATERKTCLLFFAGKKFCSKNFMYSFCHTLFWLEIKSLLQAVSNLEPKKSSFILRWFISSTVFL